MQQQLHPQEPYDDGSAMSAAAEFPVPAPPEENERGGRAHEEALAYPWDEDNDVGRGKGEHTIEDEEDDDNGGDGDEASDERTDLVTSRVDDQFGEPSSWEMSIESSAEFSSSAVEFSSSTNTAGNAKPTRRPTDRKGQGSRNAGTAVEYGLLRSSAASPSTTLSPPQRLSASSMSSTLPHHRLSAASSSNDAQQRLSSFTINRLQFHRLHKLYGRDNEQQEMVRVLDDTYSAWERRQKATAAEITERGDAAPEATPAEATAAAESSPATSVPSNLSSVPGVASAPLAVAAGDVNDPSPEPLGRHLVAIRGEAGTGKSALAASMKNAKSGCFYASGKFSQPRFSAVRVGDTTTAESTAAAVSPYEAFAGACQELCDFLLPPTLHNSSQTAAGKEGPRPPTSTSTTTTTTDSTVTTTDSPSSSQVSPDRGRKHRVLAQLRNILDEDLSDQEADALIRTLPAMEQILTARDPLPAHAAEAVADQEPPSRGLAYGPRLFQKAFCRFLRALSSLGPVVWVVDDLQWADAASLELLEAIMMDRDAVGILVVTCYRDDDPSEKEELGGAAATGNRKTLQNIQTKAKEEVDLGIGVCTIHVGCLGENEVNELLEDLLSLPKEWTVGLAQCVHRRTMGNVFFVVQFLKMLWEADLLTFNFGSMSWTWDLDAIVQSTASTENVVHLMTSKMRTLPQTICRALPVLACLGSTFSAIVFDAVLTQFATAPPATYRPAELMNQEPIIPKASEILSTCQTEGLIEELSGSGGTDQSFQWVHDKVHEAAFALIEDAAQLGSLQREMGQALYVCLDGDALERHLYTVVNLMRAPVSLDSTTKPLVDPVVAAGLYLRAGSKAIETSAFEQAAIYACAGIDHLPPTRWKSHYALALNLFSMAAEAEFCTGSFERMRQHCTEVIQQERIPLVDKRRVYAVWIESIGAVNHWGEALKLCQKILAKLGVRFPRRAVLLHILGGMITAKRTVKKDFSHRVANLPIMKDEKQLWVMYLLDRVCYFAYFLKSPLMALAIFRGLNVTLKYGICHYSPTCFASAGLILSAFMKDYQGGLTCADQALEMLKRVDGARMVEARATHVCHVLIYHWQRPLPLSIKPLLATYRKGMSVGDTETTAWCIYFHLEHSFHTGTSLEDLAADCAFYAPVLYDVKQLHIHQILLNLWQTVLLLAGKNVFDGTLTGEIVQQRTLLSREPKEEHFVANIYRMQMYLAFVFGEHRTVRNLIVTTGADKGYFEKTFPGIAGLVHVNALSALSMFSLYRETKDRSTLRLARKFASNIKRLALAGNPNVTQFDSLLDAEAESLRGEHYNACRHYEAAVLYAGRRGWRQDQALAHERYGMHLLRLANDDERHGHDAHFHLREAVKLYDEWGAHAKVDLMRRAHSSLVPLSPSPNPGIEILDMGRIKTAS